MRRILLSAATLAGVAIVLVLFGGAKDQAPASTYKIEIDNAFGLVTGADFKVAGVRAGSITGIDLDTKTLHAVVKVSVTQKGFTDFRSDVFCQTRPQSLIGEYFIECDPGRSSQKLPRGSTIPVERTQTTIAPDLLADIQRLPYRQRFSIIIGELGAAVAGRSSDLQSALRRAVPALTQTDNLLNALANDSHMLQQLTVGSDKVVTALANNSRGIQQFIEEAGKAAAVTATRNTALAATFHKLPAFLEQLKPTLAQLSAATATNTPVLQNLNASAGQLNRFFSDLVPFDRASRPALSSLGQASVTGRSAVTAATPTITDLNRFAKPAPELAQNLGIVLPALEDRNRSVENDPRSPGGKGYTGLEALLQYIFIQAAAINTFGPFSHQLAVDPFYDPDCSPYANPTSVAAKIKSSGVKYRHCYAFLGKTQPGVTTKDPSNPNATLPDPGGQEPNTKGAPAGSTPAASPASAAPQTSTTQSALTSVASAIANGLRARPDTRTQAGPSSAAPAPSSAAGSGAGAAASSVAAALTGTGGASPSAGGSASGGSAKSILNYLLAP